MFKIIKKALSVLEKKERKKLIIIVFLMVIGAGMEMLSVSLIMPVISAVTEPEKINSSQLMQLLWKISNSSTTEEFIKWILLILAAAFVLKNAFLYFEYYIQTLFSTRCKLRIQKKLVDKYLHRPYEFYVNVSSAEVLRVIFSDVGGTFQVINNILLLMTEMIVAVGLVSTIIVISPLMALLLVICLGTLSVFLVNILKPYMRRVGEIWQKNYALANKWILQAINGVKEIKVTGKEDFFQDKYDEYATEAVIAEKKNTLVSNAPRMLLETVSVSGILLVLYILLCMGNSLESLIPQLSALVVAAVRLLPSVNRINTSFNTISYQSAAVDKTIYNLNEVEKWSSSYWKNNCIEKDIELVKECKLENITFKYENSEKEILCNANMSIPMGKSIGVIGTSGAGKTTAIDILLGILVPEKGEVLADGVNIASNMGAWHKKIGYIPQMISLLDDTVRANIAFGQEEQNIDDSAIWRALEEAQIKDMVDEMPQKLDTVIGERGLRLSGGQRQRLGIARALYLNPPILVFDEATSALDNDTEKAIMDAINKLHGKKTMVIIAHRLQTIEKCDIVYKVDNGKIERER